MATAATVQMSVVSNGGPITKDVYKSLYSAGTSASEDWVKGEMLHLKDGFITRIGTFGTADAFTTGGDSFDAAYKRFIALEDHDASAFGKSVYVAVQEVRPETVLEIQLAASGSTAATLAAAKYLQGKPMGVYLSASGIWGLDVDVNAAGILVPTKSAADYNGPKITTATTGVGARSLVQLIASVIL